MATRILLGTLGVVVLVLGLSLAIPADSAPASAPVMQAVTPRPTLEPPPKPTAVPTTSPSTQEQGAELALRVAFLPPTSVAAALGQEAGTAGSGQNVASAPGSRTHTVQSGENLYRIGLAYGVSWVELASINHLANANLIYVGQVLVIPDRASNAPSGQAASQEPVTRNLYYGADWQLLWTVVEWQSPDGLWHEVGGWRGSLDRVEVDHNTGAVTGWRYWWVGRHELGRGPFRWLVYDSRGGEMLVVSEIFNLPDALGGRVIIDVSLAPK